MKLFNYKEKILKSVGSLVLALSLMSGMSVFSGSIVRADSKVYISEIRFAKGDNGNKNLTDKGYNVLSPSFITTGKSKIWLGYKTTTDEKKAIRDIVVDTLKTNGNNKSIAKKTIAKKTIAKKIIYKKTTNGIVEIGDGTKASFYTTKDSNAGEPILAINLLSSDTNAGTKFKSVMSVANNGSVVVRNVSNEPVVFKNRNSKTYLNVIKKDVWKNYISGIEIFVGATKKEAVDKIAKAGYDYYIDKNYGTDSKIKIIALSKTNDKNEALTDIIGISKKNIKLSGYKLIAKKTISGKYIYVSTNKKVGNPIANIEGLNGVDNTEVSAKEWTNAVIAGGSNQIARPYIVEQSDFEKMSESKSKFVLMNVGSDDQTDMNIMITTPKKDLSKKISYRQKILKKINKKIIINNSAEEEKSVAGVDNNSSGEANVKKTGEKENQDVEDASEELTEGEVIETVGEVDNGEGTVITPVDEETVSILQIVVLGVIAVLIPIVTFAVRKKMKSKKDNK